MADEQKIVFEFDGTSEGLKKAAAEGKASIAELVAAEQALQSQQQAMAAAGNAAQRKVSAELKAQDLTLTAPAGTSGATPEQLGALEQLAERERAAADAAKRLGDGQEKAAIDAKSMRAAILAAQNPLAFLIQAAEHGSDVFKDLFSPTGMSVAGLTAAIVVIKGLIDEWMKALAETNAKFAAWEAQLKAERAAHGEQVESTATTLGKAGITSPEAIMAADQVRKQMVQSGASREAIEKILPMAVDQAGQRTMSDEELLRASAFAEFQGDKVPEIKKPGDEVKARQRMLQRMQRQSGDVDKWSEVLAGRVGRLDVGRQQLDPTAIAKMLEQQGEILPADEKERQQQIEDVIAVSKKGIIGTKGLNWTSAAAHEEFQLRQRRAAGRAGAIGTVGAEQAARAAERTRWDTTIAGYAGDYGETQNVNPWAEEERGQMQAMPVAAGSGGKAPPSAAQSKAAADETSPPDGGYFGGQQPARQPPPAPPPPAAPQSPPPAQPVTVIYQTNNHGTVYQGTPADRSQRVVRVR